MNKRIKPKTKLVYDLIALCNVTSVSDEIDQKSKVRQNTRFFLRFFPPAHFDHGKLR